MITTGISSIFSNVTSTPGRVFVDISRRGCGSGCRYCYIDGIHEQQELVSKSELAESIAHLLEQPGFVPGRFGTLVSMCPNTEPFKSRYSTELLILALGSLLPLGNPIQIPTKEPIPKEILVEISRHVQFAGQAVVFVSTSTLSRSATFEPRAASPSERFKNFSISRETDVLACLYIKPVLSSTLRDCDLYVEAVCDYEPPLICVGIMYKKAEEYNRGALLHHPVHSNLASVGVSEDISVFRDRLSQNTSAPVFFSSVCVSAYARNWFPMPAIWRDHPELCIDCRPCAKDDERDSRSGGG